MKLKNTIPVMVSTAVLLASCGGGGGDSTTSLTTSPSSFKLTGSVPGTRIEAFCNDGSYHSINSEQNSTDKHPFILELPTDVSCRVVMITNEDDPDTKVVTPIKLVNSQGVGSIAFVGSDDIDLDHVNLAMTRGEMLSDTNQDGVEDVPREITLTPSASINTQIITAADPMDTDSDGIINAYEDDDGDGINNQDDDDDDGDGIADIDDNDHDNDGQSDNDLDGDGISNGADIDDDNDGINDDEDTDDDNDGIGDSDDNDDDNDGIDDSLDTDDDNDDDGSAGTPSTPTTPSTPIEPTAGRLLAAQCAQCHGTDGVSKTDIDSLAGESRNGLIEEMLEMQNENNNEVMHLQAKGYTAEQIGFIADYFSGLSNQARGDN